MTPHATLSPALLATDTIPAFWSPRADGILQPEGTAPSGLRRSGAALIYAVDDLPCLTELYTLLLEALGHMVRAFIDREAALAAIRADGKKPDLLITDYRGRSMPVESFLRQCRALHPGLRILMASGFNPAEIRLAEARPDAFMRKPFTPHELRETVGALLARHPRAVH